MRSRERAETRDETFGHGHGYFEWDFPMERSALDRAIRLRVLCEVSARRGDYPQTDDDLYPTDVRITVNEEALFHSVLSNHPHDSRGVLSYMRSNRGAYGYLANAVAEGGSLQRIQESTGDGVVRLRCSVPADSMPQGGLTVYGAESGRYPICPTLVLEW